MADLRLLGLSCSDCIWLLLHGGSYLDLSIYPSYPSITNCIFPTILEPGLSDIMATFAWVVILRLPRATLPLPCKNPGDSLRLSEQCQMHKLYRLRFMHENPFGPKRSEDQAKSRCLIVSWVSFSAKTSMTSFKFQTHSENACKWKMSQFCKRTIEMTSLIASGSTLLIGPLAFVIARDIPNSQASRILFPHYDS